MLSSFTRLDVHEALPSFLQPKSAKDVSRFNIRISDDLVGQPRLEMVVEWKDASIDGAQQWAKLVKKPLAEILRVVCDGPCGQKRPCSEMVNLGRCEHSVCRDCLEETRPDPHSQLKTCPVRSCSFFLEEEQAMTDDSQRWQPSELKEADPPPIKELIFCKVILVEQNGLRSYRSTRKIEWYASCSLVSLREQIAAMSERGSRLATLLAGSGPMVHREELRPPPAEAVRLGDLLKPGHSSLVFVAIFNQK